MVGFCLGFVIACIISISISTIFKLPSDINLLQSIFWGGICTTLGLYWSKLNTLRNKDEEFKHCTRR